MARKCFFSVDSPEELEPAIDLLIVLNPGVMWSWANFNYFTPDKSGQAELTVELKLLEIPMRVSAAGELIHR